MADFCSELGAKVKNRVIYKEHRQKSTSNSSIASTSLETIVDQFSAIM